jgi:hypothetical protein
MNQLVLISLSCLAGSKTTHDSACSFSLTSLVVQNVQAVFRQCSGGSGGSSCPCG